MSVPAGAASRSRGGRAGQRPLFDPVRGEVARAPQPRPGRCPRSGGESLTLELRLESVWEGLLAAGSAECPVCRGHMSRAGDTARCEGCGSELR